jgi:MSHA biogenesis protein MshJ
MKAEWLKLAAQFNARALRERLMVLFGLLFAVVALYDLVLLEPVLAKKRRAAKQVAETRTTTSALETTVKAQTQQSDPEASKRSYRDDLRKQIVEINKNMQGMQKSLVPPDQMTKLLEGVLARNRGLTLVALRKLPLQRFDASRNAAGGTAAAKPPGAAQPERTIYQHGFELTVQGSYSELHDYLARLEKLPWQMFWGKASLVTEQHPRLVLTLTVHTLSLSKSWLIV